MSFWSELKRRNVFKVGVAYAIVAWLILQVAAITFPVLHLPGWALTLVTVLLIIGFPLILLFAWAFEITPDGIKRTEHVPLAESITHLTGKKLNYVLAGLLTIAVVYIMFDNYYLDRRTIVETEVASVTPGEVPAAIDVKESQNSIAVLPFVNRSPDPGQEDFVDGLSEEILNCIAQIKGLSVTSSTSCFTFKDSGKTIQEVAGVLGVAYILEGGVRKSGSDLRITAQLIRAEDDVHLWSETYDRKLKDIFAIQEDIAKAVAKELKITLGIEQSLRALGSTVNTDAYEKYLIALGLWKGKMDDSDLISTVNRSLATLDEALAMDSEFALAWSSKAIVHIFLSVIGPSSHVIEERNAGRLAAERAIELEPDLAAGYYALGFLRSSSGDFVGGRLAHQKALELTDRPISSPLPVIAIHYLAAGYFEKAREYLEVLLQNDPLNNGTRVFYLFCLGLLGDTRCVEEEIALDRTLFGDRWQGNYHITMNRIGTGEPISSDQITYSDPALDIFKEHLDMPEEGLSELQRLYRGSEALSTWNLQTIMLCAAYFGDPEFSMDVLLKVINMEAESIFHSYFPVMREVRKLPRYKEAVNEIGLVDYWHQLGWPDICRPMENGDFVCD
jgi:TolB-like protein